MHLRRNGTDDYIVGGFRHLTRKCECGEMTLSLFGNKLQLGLLLVLLGELSQAGQ